MTRILCLGSILGSRNPKCLVTEAPILLIVQDASCHGESLTMKRVAWQRQQMEWKPRLHSLTARVIRKPRLKRHTSKRESLWAIDS